MRHMYCPPYILAPPSQKNKKTGDADGFGSSTERSTVLFVHYCLSDDQKHLLASLADDRGEMVRTTVININIPNRTRRKKVMIIISKLIMFYNILYTSGKCKTCGVKKIA